MRTLRGSCWAREGAREGTGRTAADGGPTCERARPSPLPFRLMFFEQAREQAEREFKANNQDAMVGAAAAAAWAWCRSAALPPAPVLLHVAAGCWPAGSSGMSSRRRRIRVCALHNLGCRLSAVPAPPVPLIHGSPAHSYVCRR